MQMEALMTTKGKITKALTIGTALLAMTACSTMKEIEVRAVSYTHLTLPTKRIV